MQKIVFARCCTAQTAYLPIVSVCMWHVPFRIKCLLLLVPYNKSQLFCARVLLHWLWPHVETTTYRLSILRIWARLGFMILFQMNSRIVRMYTFGFFYSFAFVVVLLFLPPCHFAYLPCIHKKYVLFNYDDDQKISHDLPSQRYCLGGKCTMLNSWNYLEMENNKVYFYLDSHVYCNERASISMRYDDYQRAITQISTQNVMRFG